jgi:hypothetical protein
MTKETRKKVKIMIEKREWKDKGETEVKMAKQI